MNNLSIELRNISEFISLILVFVTVLFGIRYPQILEDIKKEIPAGTKAKKRHKVHLFGSLAFKGLPILIINFFSSYLFLPLVLEITRDYEFVLWDFDFFVSAFVFISFLIFYFFIWSLYLCIRLLIRIIKCR
jgi:hypothetical protein